MTSAELATALGLNQGNANKLLDKLESRAHLRRDPTERPKRWRPPPPVQPED